VKPFTYHTTEGGIFDRFPLIPSPIFAINMEDRNPGARGMEERED
jgi:hypothetical protein